KGWSDRDSGSYSKDRRVGGSSEARGDGEHRAEGVPARSREVRIPRQGSLSEYQMAGEGGLRLRTHLSTGFALLLNRLYRPPEYARHQEHLLLPCLGGHRNSFGDFTQPIRSVPLKSCRDRKLVQIERKQLPSTPG